MAYRSEIDIKLGLLPTIKNEELLGDMVDLYNACHILNQGLSHVIKSVRDMTSGEGEPWETARHMKFINAPAAMSIKTGDLVTLTDLSKFVWRNENTGEEWKPFGDYPPGVIRGWAPTSLTYYEKLTGPFSFLPHYNRPIYTQTFPVAAIRGLALSDANNVGDNVKIAIDPGVLQIDDETIWTGQSFVAKPAWSIYHVTGGANSGLQGPNQVTTNFDGALYRVPADKDYYFINAFGDDFFHAGMCVGFKSLYVEPPIFDPMRRPTPPAPPPDRESSGGDN